MRIPQFLEHHGIAANPFAEEDAQTDPVFKQHCIASTYHPAWDKIYGDPADPATSVIFGEKGSGKTALRLQLARHLDDYNRAHPRSRVFVIEYDDFNPFLDRFADRLGARRRRVDRMLAQWRLWDHMDAILSIGVTRLVDQLLADEDRGLSPFAESSEQKGTVPLSSAANDAEAPLDRNLARDLLLLAACYDQSLAETRAGRWQRLRRRLRFRVWRAQWDLALGWAVTAAVAIAVIGWWRWDWLGTVWPYLILLAGWAPRLWRNCRSFLRALGIARHVRVGAPQLGALRQILLDFMPSEINGQPLPNKDRTDDRYELLNKFQGVLRALGYAGIIVLVDRVDEPHLINGSAEPMRALLWPMLDNKLLKHPGLGFKLLLPIELSRFIEREQADFFQRSRLDKQNMIPSLEWTGEALYDLATARVSACAGPNETPSLADLFDPAIDRRRLVEAFGSLRVPRHLFKFMYRLLVAHGNAHTDDQPAWTISAPMFEAQLALYRREQDAFDRGVGVV